MSRPQIKEYSHPAPNGSYWGTVGENVSLTAHDVQVVWIPEDHHRRKPAEFGLAIKIKSKVRSGHWSWVNVSRGRVRYCDMEMPDDNLPVVDAPEEPHIHLARPPARSAPPEPASRGNVLEHVGAIAPKYRPMYACVRLFNSCR